MDNEEKIKQIRELKKEYLSELAALRKEQKAAVGEFLQKVVDDKIAQIRKAIQLL